MTRYILIVVIFLLSSDALAVEDTYLLFDVDVAGYANRDPVFLAVEGVHKGVNHLRIERHLLPIPPGEYRLGHIDFHEPFLGSFHGFAGSGARPRSLHLVPERGNKGGVKFVLQEGYINYIGVLNVSKNSKAQIELKFVSEKSLVRKACAINPGLLAEKLIKMVFAEDNNKEYKIGCESLTS
ncbi:hypothetical protein [Microbulbifer pacificus]|uniref:DUF5625 domain-containing protein n=1 Tax=Microbulbifer pacificus TaxID=407164 RepID=A0AAU0MYI0_9GAMM|nr:hypothetical protein [Microbulbifer pacificus]WOX05068.1 hypothetical protein R5R33_15165 [Microbulbifer pacificus]